MTLPPEALDELRRAASTRPDIERIVFVEREVSPRSEPPFAARQLVVVLSEPPASPPEPAFSAALFELLRPVSARLDDCSIVVPSPLGTEPATRGGSVVYERGPVS